MKKQVLILCTGNSCRSIMAEAIINSHLSDCVIAHSSGVKASGQVNPHAQALLTSKGEWQEHYHSKLIETVMDTEFDLVITVCAHANETCPTFPKAVKTVHVGFDDPSGLIPVVIPLIPIVWFTYNTLDDMINGQDRLEMIRMCSDLNNMYDYLIDHVANSTCMSTDDILLYQLDLASQRDIAFLQCMQAIGI